MDSTAGFARGVNVPAELLALARDANKQSVFVVGTAKNAGKTVVTRSIARAAHAAGLTLGVTSIGRDGERVDASHGGAKPQLFLREGTIVATARTLLPGSPASEVLDISKHATAAGNVVFARVRLPGRFEIAGPPTASGVRTVVQRLFEFGCDQVVVDGAIDRLAALAGGDDAIVLATGAASGATADEVVEEIAALASRLRLARYDPHEPFVRVDGALTADMAAGFVTSGERRQIVVRDPTQVTISGRAFRGFAERLRLCCERPLHLVAATACAFARDRSFNPRDLLIHIAEATGLPAFDVYAGTAART